MERGDKIIDSYALNVNDIVVDVTIITREDEPEPTYKISITNISETTKIILGKLRDEFVSEETKTISDENNLENISTSGD